MTPPGGGRSRGGRGKGPVRAKGATAGASPTGRAQPAAKPAGGAGGRGRGGRTDRPDRSAGLPSTRQSAPKGLGGEQVEGRQAVRELLLAGRRRVHEILMAADLDPAPILDDIRELAEAARVPIRPIPRARLEAQARTDAPQGVLAMAATLPESTLEELAETPPGGPAPFLLVLDGVTDPGNVGALMRTADGAGVTGVVLPRHRAVHVTPSVTKSAAGAIEHLPMALVGGLPAALSRLRELGVWVIGFDADADRPLWELDLGDEPVALVLGAEGAGLSRLARQRCDQVVAIPLRGSLSSLNVASAGALACFEVARHRTR